jgi:hypothetical protein
MKATPALIAWAAFLPLAMMLPERPAYSQSNIVKALQIKLTGSIAKVESSCSEEIKKYCSTVTPGEERILHCMQAHDDKINPKCVYDVHEAALNLQMIAGHLKDAVMACRDDIARFCGDIRPGEGRVAQCLATNKAVASQSCASAIQKLEAFAAE